MSDTDPSFLGRGWSFPPTFSRGAASVEMVSGPEDIHQSLMILLSTRIGERVMVPEYGCALWSVVFENLTTSLLTRIQDMVERAIVKWEPRIRVEDVLTEVDPPGSGIMTSKVFDNCRMMARFYLAKRKACVSVR